VRLTIDLFGYRLEIHPNELGADESPGTYEPDRGTTASLIDFDGQPDAGELKHQPLQAPSAAFGLSKAIS
jgi:hypothetical protein